MRKNPPAQWVLPAVVNPTSRRCIQIEVPDDPAHIAAFRGALLSLSSAYNWSDDSAHTAKEVALVWRDILDNSFTWGCGDPNIRPFFQNAEEANDPTLPDYPWYEQIEDWIISLFLAVTVSPGAAIVYRATIPKIRLVLRTGNLGAIFRVLIDGLEFITGDNYSAIKKLVEIIIDIKTFAEEHNLGPGPHMVKIVNVGRESGPGGNVLEVCRGNIQPEENMFDVRWDGCTLQKTEDGVTWVDVGDITECATGIADAEILSQVMFSTDDTALTVSLNGGTEYQEIYDAAPIADAEILSQVMFSTDDTALTVSLNGGTEYQEIYDAAPIADDEILNRISFGTQGTALTVSLNGGTEYGEIYDAAPIADDEIAARIYHQQVGNALSVSLDQGNSYATWFIESLVNALIPPDWVSRPAAGDSVEFDLICRAGQHVLLPCTVQSDDIVQVSTIAGAWAENSLAMTTDLADGAPQWYTPDGYYYPDGTQAAPENPVWGVPYMALIARTDGNITPIPVYDGNEHILVDLDVPGRMWFMAAHTPMFEEAYPSTAPEYARIRQLDVSGYAAFHVTVTVPAPAVWCYTFDFTTGQHDWTIGDGYYSTGVGFISRADSSAHLGIDLIIATPCTLTSYEMSGNAGAAGNNGDRRLQARNTDSQWPILQSYDGTGAINPIWTGTADNINKLSISFDTYNNPATNTIYSVTLHGTGTNPFGTDNC